MDDVKWTKNSNFNKNNNTNSNSTTSSSSSSNLLQTFSNTSDTAGRQSNFIRQETVDDSRQLGVDSSVTAVVDICLTEPAKYLQDNKKTNDSFGKFSVDGGLDRQSQIQQIVESTISEESRIRIHEILELVSALTSPEKLLLYLRLPTDTQTISDPLRQPLNPLGSRTEISQTINWIRTHLEEDQNVAMQKQDVYEEYTAYCSENEMKALSTADFGKVMKQVYPRVRPRRLGTRGNSKYCYAGLRKRIKLEAPILPDLLDIPKSTEFNCSQADLMEAASRLVREWAENLLNMQFPTLDSLACHLIKIGIVDTRSMAALTIINYFGRNSDKFLKKDSALNQPTSGKYREAQLHLQRKLQQREIIREQKRKLQLQTSNCDTTQQINQQIQPAPSKRTKKLKLEQQYTPPTTTTTTPIATTTPRTSPTGQHNSMTTAGQLMPTTDLIADIALLQTTTGLVSSSNKSNNICSSSTSSSSSNTITTTSNNASVSQQTLSPQQFAQGTNISGTLRVISLCDNNKSKTTQLQQQQQDNTIKTTTALPDFSSFQNSASFNHNTTGIQQDIIHDFSNKKSKTAKKQNSTITIKSFANKPLSRSNSYENKNENLISTSNSEVINCIQPTIGSTAAVNAAAIINSKPTLKTETKKQKLQTPRLPNPSKTKLTCYTSNININNNNNNNQQQTKYKVQDLPKIDNSGLLSITNSDPLRSQSTDNNTLKESPSSSLYTLGYYNQLPDSNFDKTVIKTEVLTDEHKLVQSDNVNVTTFTRERNISIGNIDKDALDDYLFSGSNSQEQEEEIMQYFQNDSSSIEDYSNSQQEVVKTEYNTPPSSSGLTESKIDDPTEKSDKISQLRLLLEKNLKTNKLDTVSATDQSLLLHENLSSGPINEMNYNILYQHHNSNSESNSGGTGSVSVSSGVHNQKSLILSSLLSSSSAKRRVSFDTTPDPSSVPPSPNTRRKNFSFTPISPGPNSPGGCNNGTNKQSKNSSTNASPFVSPRSTPVSNKYNRNHHRSNQSANQQLAASAVVNRNKKSDMKLSIDINKTQPTSNIGSNGPGSSGQFVIPNEHNQNLLPGRKHNLPMSAPPSPMLPYRHNKINSHTNYLQTLLDTDLPARSNYIPSNECGTNINDYIDRKLEIDNATAKQQQKTNLKMQLTKLKIDNSTTILQQHQQQMTSTTNQQNLDDPLQQNITIHPPSVQSDLTSSTLSSASSIINSADPLSQEVSQFFPDEPPNLVYTGSVDNLLFRSQSVPLRNNLDDVCNNVNSTGQYYNPQSVATSYNNQFMVTSNVTSTCSSVGQTPVPSEFSDFSTSILNNENLDNVIFNFLQQNEPSGTVTTSGTDASSGADMSNILCSNYSTELNNFLPESSGSSALLRSHSIDFTPDSDTVKFNSYAPSRSVPSTPLPYHVGGNHTSGLSNDYETSKSHPSTPLIGNETTFSYKQLHIGDFLLNGQPISNKSYNYLPTKKEHSMNSTSETFPSHCVDDAFTFPDTDTLLTVDTGVGGGNITPGTINSSNSANDDILQLTDTDNNTSDNFITSTNSDRPKHANIVKK